MCLQIAQINCALWRPVTLRNWTQHKAACWWPHSLLSTPSVSETFIFLEWAKPVVCTHIYIYICVCVCVCVFSNNCPRTSADPLQHFTIFGICRQERLHPWTVNLWSLALPLLSIMLCRQRETFLRWLWRDRSYLPQGYLRCCFVQTCRCTCHVVWCTLVLIGYIITVLCWYPCDSIQLIKRVDQSLQR